jgi:PleD family two-component response regulator
VSVGETLVGVTMSAGVASLSRLPDAKKPARSLLESLIKRADVGLYAAKKAGRNRVAVAAEGITS